MLLWGTFHTGGSRSHLCLVSYLSNQILLQIVAAKEHPSLKAATLQLQVLPLTPQQIGFFLRLEMLDVLLLLGEPLLLLLLWSALVFIQLLVRARSLIGE